MRKCISILLLLVMALSVGSAAYLENAPKTGGTVVVGLSYEPDTMNVYSTHLLGDVQATMVEGLLVPDENMTYQPVLALETPSLENGLIVINEGNTMDITYHLRQDVLWHDGEKFTAEDVVFTWEALSNDAWDAESKDGVDQVSSIDTPDDYTVIVHYKAAFTDFASTLFTFGILPKHVCEGVDLNENTGYNVAPIGTGPYKFSEWAPGEYIKVVANTDYYGDGPYLDAIYFRFITDENTRIAQLKTGEIDFAYGLTYENYDEVSAIEGTTAYTMSMNSWRYMAFNNNKPGLDEVAVRQAIAYAIDRDALVNQLFNGIPNVWSQPWQPKDPFAVQGFEGYKYNPEKSAALLDEAGWVLNGSGVREKDGETLSFTISCVAGRAVDEAVEQVVMAYLDEVGIKLTIDNAAASTQTARLYAGEFELACGGWIVSPTTSRSFLYGTGEVLNRGRWSNAEFDKIIYAIDFAMDEAERKELVAQAVKIFNEELPELALFNTVDIVCMNSRLKGVKLNPTNMTHFCQSGSWYLD
ncbi:ABC transporter substrate-binding protein [Clostridia bacterium]|nr:ABC transporter substrate-binding protein [Clostridia bacterium]